MKRGLVAVVLLLGACAREATVPAHAAPAQVTPASPTPSPLAPLAPGGADFSAEVRLLFRVVACGGAEPLPAAFDAAIADQHCRWLQERVDPYRNDYLARLTPFFAARRPAGLPTTVVYPFGGGDLLSALATYPDGLEFTTLGLELAGDPRRIKELDSARLRASLLEFEKRVKGLFAYAESTSENMMQLQRGDLPGQIAFFLVALRAHGYEPVGLRYFRLEPSGAVHYLTTEEIATEEGKIARKRSSVWVSPDFSEAFSNSELTFRKAGEKDAPLRVHRHIAANLADSHLKADPSVLLHLEAKGKVAAMTKAASYLLWAEGFSLMGKYLVDHMVFMVADSTGPPPSVVTKAGFTMETYGRFEGPFLAARKSVADEYRKLWSEQPARELNFRYGYPDSSKSNHLVITRPGSPPSRLPARRFDCLPPPPEETQPWSSDRCAWPRPLHRADADGRC